jgi:asparagine synthase (glutamine-hydrolysing)
VCGIAGFVEASRDGSLAPMLAALAQRGPDGHGTWETTQGGLRVAFGHRRLSIIDLETGAQPMQSAHSTITFNGEIYRYRELRAELERRGRVFQTKSDTEVILHLYEEHGIDGLRHLDGMFAFALWDARTSTLVLARDRIGIKPLYWAALDGGGIAFASELTALVEHPRVPRALSTEGLVSYFFSDYAHAPLTLVRGVHKLEPGHVLEWRRRATTRPFVTLPDPQPCERGASDLARELWERLDAAVHRELVADVPVGVFLSGGLDSSIVATLAGARKAFSIGFSDTTFDETEHARSVARAIGAEHVVRVLDESALLDILEPALARLDEPLADPSYLPTYLLSALAAEHVKVVLSGDGADEIWGGYPTYLAHVLAPGYGVTPRVVRGVIGRAVAKMPVDERYQGLQWKLSHFVGRFDEDPLLRHLRWLSTIDVGEITQAIRGADDVLPATLGSTTGKGTMNDILALDVRTYLPGSVLTKVDRASMAHGLEVRPAMLDDDLVDFAMRLPSRFKVRGLARKALLGRAARGHLPRSVLARTKKGFGIPLARWMNGPLAPHVERVLDDSPVWGALEPATFRRFQREHAARKIDRSKPLWSMLVLDRWMRRLY